MKQSWNQQVPMVTRESATGGVPARRKCSPGKLFTTNLRPEKTPDELVCATADGSSEPWRTSSFRSNQTVTLTLGANPVPATVTVCPLPNLDGVAVIIWANAACAKTVAPENTTKLTITRRLRTESTSLLRVFVLECRSAPTGTHSAPRSARPADHVDHLPGRRLVAFV